MGNRKGYFLAALGFLILFASLVLGTPFTGFGSPQGTTAGPQARFFDVFVTNTPEQPVPTKPIGTTDVLVLNTNALLVSESSLANRRPWSKWVIVDAEGTDYQNVEVLTVPEGWVLHIEAINADGCLEDALAKMTCNLTVWPRGYQATPGMPPDDNVIPKIKILMSEQGFFRKMMHWGANQQVKFYVEGGQALWAEMYRSHSVGEGEVRIWLTGYLVPAVQTPGGGWTPGQNP